MLTNSTKYPNVILWLHTLLKRSLSDLLTTSENQCVNTNNKIMQQDVTSHNTESNLPYKLRTVCNIYGCIKLQHVCGWQLEQVLKVSDNFTCFSFELFSKFGRQSQLYQSRKCSELPLMFQYVLCGEENKHEIFIRGHE